MGSFTLTATAVSALPDDSLHPLRMFARRLDHLVRVITEVPAAVLVILEVLILLANVIFRYALQSPLIWGDELAALLFIWLSMIGAVIALRRGEHLRLTTIVGNMSPGRQRFFDTFGHVVVLTFMLCLLAPAFEYAKEEWVITTLALEIPHSIRVSSVLFGAALMLLTGVSRLLRSARLGDFLGSSGIVCGTAMLLWLMAPLLVSLGTWNLAVFFLLGVTSLVTIGIPIMTAFGLATLSYLSFATKTPAIVMVGRLDEGMSNPILLAVPLFVFLGALIEAMGMAEAMIRFLATLVGHFRGGMSYVLVGAMYLVSGISGSKTADMAAVAPAPTTWITAT